MEEIKYSDPEVACFKIKEINIFKSSKDLPSFFFNEVEVDETEEEETILISDSERSLAETVWEDDSARLVLLAKHMSEKAISGSDREADTSNDQETLDPDIAARLLQLACRLDSVECAKVLIEGDTGTVVRVNEMDGLGRTPLQNAAEMHSKKCIDLLLTKNARTDLRSKDGDSLLALEFALSSKRMQVDWSPKESVEELLVLLRERDLSAIRLLAEATKEVAEVSYMRAMEGRIVELAMLLLVAADEVIALVSIRGEVGSSAENNRTIYESVVGETLALWEIEKRARLDSKRDGYSWDSVESCRQKRELFLREMQLLQMFAAFAVAGNICKDKRALTPLLRASQIGDESVVKLLLQAGADVNETDADGNSALHWCLSTGATSRDPRLMWLLLKHGARVSQRNRLGLTPVHVAASKGNHQGLQILLLQAPECVDLASETQETPLFFAVKNEFLGCTELLLRYGANSQALNLRRQRPIDFAKSQDMRFILNPANHGFSKSTSLPREEDIFWPANEELNEEVYEQVLEIKNEPADTESTLNSSDPNAKTGICRYYESPSGCARGAKCYYAHAESELRRAKIGLLELKPVAPFRNISRHPLRPSVFDRKIFVGGLPSSVDSEYLKEFFQSEFGPVEDATVIGSPAGNQLQSRGFGFVTFEQEETFAIAVEAHFVTIFGKRVEIKSAVVKHFPAAEATSPSFLRPQPIYQKDLDVRSGEPSWWLGSPQPYHSKTIATDQQTIRTESLPEWVTKFRKWLPVFLKEACKRLGEGEWYPLSSLKGDFRATCGMELDHASLGFLKLSDFMRFLPGLCRMRVVPVGSGPATHMVLSPLRTRPHHELLQKMGLQQHFSASSAYLPLNAVDLPLSLPISEVNEDASSNTKSKPLEMCMGCTGSGEGSSTSNPSRNRVFDFIQWCLRSPRIIDEKHPVLGRLKKVGTGISLPPTSDGSKVARGSMQPPSFSFFEKQWDHFMLAQGLCIVCCSQPGSWDIIPCLHKVCNGCIKSRVPGMCVICGAEVQGFRPWVLGGVKPWNPNLSDADYPPLGSGQQQSCRSQHAMPRANPSAVCQLKYACQGARASVCCLPCGHKIACRSCIPPSKSMVPKPCITCGGAVDLLEYLDG